MGINIFRECGYGSRIKFFGAISSFLLLSTGSSFADTPLLWIDHDQTSISAGGDSGYQLVDSKNRRNHEVKLEGDGSIPKIVYYPRYGRNVAWFEMEGKGGHEKDRSEIRIKGENLSFGVNHFLSFDMYLPSWADESSKKGFNVFAQCAQIGASKPYYPEDTSPPFALELRGDLVYLVVRYHPGAHVLPVSKELIAKFDREFFIGIMPKDKWVNFRIYLRQGRKGRVSVQMDKEVMYDSRIFEMYGYLNSGYVGANNPFTGREECSFRYGIYKSGKHLGRYGLLFKDVKLGTDNYQVFSFR